MSFNLERCDIPTTYEVRLTVDNQKLNYTFFDDRKASLEAVYLTNLHNVPMSLYEDGKLLSVFRQNTETKH